jgi:hypothetical protein
VSALVLGIWVARFVSRASRRDYLFSMTRGHCWTAEVEGRGPCGALGS